MGGGGGFQRGPGERGFQRGPGERGHSEGAGGVVGHGLRPHEGRQLGNPHPGEEKDKYIYESCLIKLHFGL